MSRALCTRRANKQLGAAAALPALPSARGSALRAAPGPGVERGQGQGEPRSHRSEGFFGFEIRSLGGTKQLSGMQIPGQTQLREIPAASQGRSGSLGWMGG